MAIISQDLAERNELKIGDCLTAYRYSAEDQGFTGQEIRVQIIGLFTPNAVEQFGETVTTYDKIQNRVFVDLQTSKEIDGGEINYGFPALHVAIDDPQDMARVVADVKALPGIDWKAFTIEADNETYESAAAPLAALNELVVTLLTVIIVVSAIILALILTLWTKTRIHEIGVFLSVGIRKSAIIGQYLIEVRLTARLDAAPVLERLRLTKGETQRNVLKLSGGQQQRIAIARALASDTPVILADEPTGNLDADTAGEITAVLKESARAFRKCVVVVTHDREVAKQADMVLKIKHGHLNRP